MIKRILKLVLLFALVSRFLADFSQADFFEQIESYGNTFSTSDWTAPPIPQLRTPTDGAFVNSSVSLQQTWTAVEDTYSNPVTYYYESCNTDPTLSGGVCSSIRGVGSFTEADKHFIDGEWRIVREATGEAEGTFWWRVKAIDALGNESNWSEVWQLTVDNTPPVISNISAVPTETMALVNWITDELATSQVEYGIDISYGSVTTEDPTLLTTHAETLTSLTANTLYHFRVHSKDAAGNETVSSDQTFTTNPHPVMPGDVVVNEVYYDTVGIDSDEEWIELYNASSGPVDLSGWKLTDLEGTFVIPSGTVMNSDSFLVIARNQTGFFNLYGFNPNISGLNLSLANDGDEIILRTAGDVDIDAVVYEGGSYGGITPHPGVASGHSIARSPKGADTDDCSVDFVDNPSPNPGTNPHPPLQTELDFYFRDDKKAVGFKVSGILPFNKLDYEIVYEADEGTQGIVGSLTIPEGENEITQNDLLLGTCSSLGEVCVYHTGIESIKLTVTLTGSGIPDRILEKTLEL